MHATVRSSTVRLAATDRQTDRRTPLSTDLSLQPCVSNNGRCRREADTALPHCERLSNVSYVSYVSYLPRIQLTAPRSFYLLLLSKPNIIRSEARCMFLFHYSQNNKWSTCTVTYKVPKTTKHTSNYSWHVKLLSPYHTGTLGTYSYRSALRFGRFTPGRHLIGDRVGLTAGLDRCGKSRPPPRFAPRTIEPVASRYTDYANHFL